MLDFKSVNQKLVENCDIFVVILLYNLSYLHLRIISELNRFSLVGWLSNKWRSRKFEKSSFIVAPVIYFPYRSVCVQVPFLMERNQKYFHSHRVKVSLFIPTLQEKQF